MGENAPLRSDHEGQAKLSHSPAAAAAAAAAIEEPMLPQHLYQNNSSSVFALG